MAHSLKQTTNFTSDMTSHHSESIVNRVGLVCVYKERHQYSTSSEISPLPPLLFLPLPTFLHRPTIPHPSITPPTRCSNNWTGNQSRTRTSCQSVSPSIGMTTEEPFSSPGGIKGVNTCVPTMLLVLPMANKQYKGCTARKCCLVIV